MARPLLFERRRELSQGDTICQYKSAKQDGSYAKLLERLSRRDWDVAKTQCNFDAAEVALQGALQQGLRLDSQFLDAVTQLAKRQAK